MRALLIICLLGLQSVGTAFGQESKGSTLQSTGKSAERIREIDERVAGWLKTCLADWDAATHMTTKEWKTTCHRVASERRQFLLEDPGSAPIGSRARPR